MGSMIIIGGFLGTTLGMIAFNFFNEIGKLSLIISLSYMYLLAIIGTLMLIHELTLMFQLLLIDTYKIKKLLNLISQFH